MSGELYYSILEAKYKNKYSIEIIFDDGKSKTVDFYPFLKSSSHLEIKKYLDLELFKNFKVVNGDLIWGDFDLTFPIDQLYKGHIKLGNSSSSQEAS